MVHGCRWDIHPDGHCYHPSGLDAYVSVDADPQGGRKLAGPYSSRVVSLSTSEEFVKSAMRSLVDQLETEVFNPGEFVVWGLLGVKPSNDLTSMSVMGVELPFLCNPTLRTSLWDECSVEDRERIHAREWILDHSKLKATHRLGLEFEYQNEKDSVLVHCRPCRNLEGHSMFEFVRASLIEILAEQGYAGLLKFRPIRHFHKLIFESSLVA